MYKRRHERVRELLKRQLGQILLRELPVAEAGVVTVHDVVMSGDLQSATVYLGTVGSPEQKRRTLALVQQQRSRIQNRVADAVILKYTPHLRFVMDESVARGDRVLRILEEIESSHPPETV